MLKRIFVLIALLITSPAYAANTSLSNLSAGAAISGTDLFYDVQTAGTGGVKVTGTQLQTFMANFFGTGNGTVTNIATTSGVTGGPLTTTGTLGLATIGNNGVLCNNSGGTAVPTSANCTVTGTGSAVLATSPTLGGTIAGTLAFSGAVTLNSTLQVLGTVTASSTVTIGQQSHTQGSIVLDNAAAGADATTLQSSNSATQAWTLTLPVSPGSNGFVLQTDGSGNTSWVGSGGGGGTPCTTTALAVQYNAAGSFGCVAGWTSNGTNLIGSTTASITWNSDTSLARSGAAFLTLGDGTTPASFAVYNTVDVQSGPTNFESGVFGWVANNLVIGTGKGGTGSARNMEFVNAGVDKMDFGTSNAGAWTLNSNSFVAANMGFTILGGSLTFNDSGNSQNHARLSFFSGNTLPQFIFESTGIFGWSNSSTGLTTVDTGLGRNANGVVEVDNGVGGTLRNIITQGYTGGGTLPTVTGSCAVGGQKGGATVGSFVAGTCAAGTFILTFAASSTNGWACDAEDLTTNTDTLKQTTTAPTSITLLSTTVSNDVVQFKCMGY